MLLYDTYIQEDSLKHAFRVDYDKQSLIITFSLTLSYDAFVITLYCLLLGNVIQDLKEPMTLSVALSQKTGFKRENKRELCQKK